MDYLESKTVAVLTINSLDDLEDRIKKLIKSGYDVLEVTLRTSFAIDAIKIIKTAFPEVKVGAGTVLTIEQLDECVNAGADFGVAPGLNKELILKAKTYNFDFIPGVATPTEIEAAIQLGINLVKIFPAKTLGGIDYIRAISGPYHEMKYMPTGGVTEDNHKEYLDLKNVFCVGGSWMF
ncbi:bifunctional 4-hydroxy-2-oxoglutarate aldolase/2-dehydro-3-deoxy-phosphogluconate aldolase [Aliivibrio fischeri]|uniref:bifunctional 4-hydroxy-2-oxoglutarate aldolase/2-dehydro-3-deoxy-phosphogluconate aldolase n=1 Tax=Aliivibrio fischeri TaxID=668 RepID=UPI0012DA7EBF|nr:bifunctional 4-hydroxy-2-oxoglutarate aldolase/2-dehydro-3-deoxy-phosphogluconate aldolase [Aliivibrio fischeri]MUL16620.1 bifunctional 4-hydroxy-2-oxoglutarate aldolase/2-dehydro-3-deoxy-phosphogluconate aldolase [Aliivibrio fischeri]